MILIMLLLTVMKEKRAQAVCTPWLGRDEQQQKTADVTMSAVPSFIHPMGETSRCVIAISDIHITGSDSLPLPGSFCLPDGDRPLEWWCIGNGREGKCNKECPPKSLQANRKKVSAGKKWGRIWETIHFAFCKVDEEWYVLPRIWMV